MEEVKQVIVIRKDLGMRRGKEIAQGSHASMAWLTERMRPAGNWALIDFSDAERAWVNGSFAKVVCQVDSLETLMDVSLAAKLAGLEVHVITDSGRTEFHGEPTVTCLAVGPDYVSTIDAVTGGLALY